MRRPLLDRYGHDHDESNGNKRQSRAVARRLALALLLCLVMQLTVGYSAALAATPVEAGGKAVVTNTDGDPIRVRDGAGTQYARIAWAREGDVVSVLAGPVTDSSGIVWYRIQFGSTKGWMMAEFLRASEPRSSAGLASPPATTAPAPAPAPAAAKLTGNAVVTNTNGDPLRVRFAPNASARVVGFFYPNATVEVVEGPVTSDDGIVWYHVRGYGLDGWSMAQYLSQAGSAPVQAQQPVQQPVQPAQPSSGGNPGLAQLRAWMEEARALYPYSESIDKMWSVMMCESGGNPNAVGGGRYLGLFQYHPSTWAGSWNPYRSTNIYDAKAQIFATAKAWSIGMQNHWSCY